MQIYFRIIATLLIVAVGFGFSSDQALAYTPYTIKLESSPWDIAVNSVTNMIYVSHVDGISVIDGSDYSMVAAIPLGANDYVEGIDVNPLTNMLYAAARDSNVVYVIDMQTNKVVDKIPAKGEPGGVAVNPATNLVYVANVASGRSESYNNPVHDDLVSVIDGATNQVITDIDVGSKFLSEEGITRETEGIGVNRPTTISVNTKTNMVYVGGGISEAIVAIDGSTNEVVATIAAEGSHLESSIDLKRNMIYFSNSGMDKIDIVDGSSNTLAYSIDSKENRNQPFSFPKDVEINAETNKLYVADLDSIIIINPDERKVTKTIDVGGYKDIAINPETNLVFVTVRDSNSLIILDGKTDEMVLNIASYTYEFIGITAAASVAIVIVYRYKRKSS